MTDVLTGDERTFPPQQADERSTLTGFLQHHRDTLRWKCSGLTPDQLVQRSIPSSNLTLLGLVRHLADVEVGWFNHHFEGRKGEYFLDYSEDRDAEFNIHEADEALVSEAWANFDAQAAKSDAVVAAHQLDDIATGTTREGEQMSLRWILVHLIEEYARHNGHADLLREAIDGTTGE
jgi:uncharacterized damage-inducible protein DinB